MRRCRAEPAQRDPCNGCNRRARHALAHGSGIGRPISLRAGAGRSGGSGRARAGCTSPGVVAAAAPRRAARRRCCSSGSGKVEGAICGRRRQPCTGARSRAGQRARGDRRVRRDCHHRHRLARGHPRGPGPRSGRVLRAPRHRARATCSTTRARSPPRRATHDGPCVVNGPIAVRGAEPGDILQVDVLGLAPARAVRRPLQPPRRRARATPSRSSRRCAAPTAASAPTCRSRASCGPSSRSIPTWGSWASRATTLTYSGGPRRRLDAVPADPRPGREVLHRRSALRARGRRSRSRRRCGRRSGSPSCRAGPRGRAAERRRLLGRAGAPGRADAPLAARVAGLPRRGARDAARARLRPPRRGGHGCSRAGPSRAAPRARARASRARCPCRRARPASS